MKTLIVLGLALSALAFTEQMMSLEELSKFSINTLDCSKRDQFSLIEKQMKQWEDLLKHKQAITHDIKILAEIEKMLTTKQHSFLETQAKVSGKGVLKKLHKLELPLTKSQIGLTQVKLLKEQCHALDSEDHQDRAAAKKELCRLLREYINSLKNCRQQCNNTPITVIKIKGQIKDLEIVRGGCSNNGTQNSGVKVVTTDNETHEITIHHGKGHNNQDQSAQSSPSETQSSSNTENQSSESQEQTSDDSSEAPQETSQEQQQEEQQSQEVTEQEPQPQPEPESQEVTEQEPQPEPEQQEVTEQEPQPEPESQEPQPEPESQEPQPEPESQEPQPEPESQEPQPEPESQEPQPDDSSSDPNEVPIY